MLMYDQALLLDDPLFDEHRADGPHPERPERLAAAREAVERARGRIRFLDLESRDATDDELVRVHSERYVHELGRVAGHHTMLDADTFVAPRSVDASRRAAGAAVALVDGLLGKMAPWGAALVRPPGHHARPDAAMGFCLLNNVAIAAAHARSRGVDRVLVLDWDVHHGNGTQEMFYADPSVLYVSLHQFPYYPGTGAVDELGSRDGRGHTVNVPLSGGAGDADYVAAFDRVVCPIAEEFKPSLTLLSAGFDAHVRDPLGGMALSDEGYGALTERVIRAVGRDCPIGLVLEGGYDLAGLRGALEAALLVLSGAPSEPVLGTPSAHHEREIARAESALKPYWAVL